MAVMLPVFGDFLSGLFYALLYIVFFLAAVLLIVIVLLQEGKGGGFAAAFGGVGTEAFGVKAGGINKFTAVLAAIFIVTALVLGALNKTGGSVATDVEAAPPAAPAGAGAPAPAPAPPPGNR